MVALFPSDAVAEKPFQPLRTGCLRDYIKMQT